MLPKNKFLITQSLLSSWQWSLALDKHEDFLKTLRREPIQQTKAMLEGIRFEDVLCETLNGTPLDPKHEWARPIADLYPILHGAQQQVKLSADMRIDGVNFVLYGVLDFLKGGVIYDTKYSKTYKTYGKYFDSPQHPMYFALVPEAKKFAYLICDGEEVYTETYYPLECTPIEQTIKGFMRFLDNMGLVDEYVENWRSKY